MKSENAGQRKDFSIEAAGLLYIYSGKPLPWMFVVLISAFCSRLNTGFLCRLSKFESPADAGLSNRSIGAEAPAAAFGKTAFADFASARYKSIGAEAPAAAFGRTASADFASAMYKY